VAQAQRFLRETGVDILVPNVGTEHRATADKVVYQSLRAREISAAVGKILCLHGTSSVRAEDLPLLPADGFIKINVFTTLAVGGGQAIARQVLASVGNILDEQELRQLVAQGVLGTRVLDPVQGSSAKHGPRLQWVANAPRRDAWATAVKERCKDFLRIFYRGYAR